MLGFGHDCAWVLLRQAVECVVALLGRIWQSPVHCGWYVRFGVQGQAKHGIVKRLPGDPGFGIFSFPFNEVCAMSRLFFLACALAMTASFAAVPVQAQTEYQRPPESLAQLVDAPRTPYVSLSPTREVMLFLHPPSVPPIADMAAPELRLAGTRINPRNNGRSRSGGYLKLSLKDLGGGARTAGPRACRREHASAIRDLRPTGSTLPLPSRCPTALRCMWPPWQLVRRVV